MPSGAGIGLGERTFERVGDLANDVVETRTQVRAHVQDESRGPHAASHREIVMRHATDFL